jgi:Tol biopolymer transport system component
MTINIKHISRLLLTALCLLILIPAAPGQNRLTMPYGSKKPVLEPTLFAPDMISTGEYELCPQISPDGRTFYFVKSTPDMNFWTIVFSQFENGKWSGPQVAPFSGQYSDADEFITADGKRMFFVSRRPVNAGISPNAAGRLDIWVTDKIATGWSEPKNLGTPVNSEGSEYFPTLTSDGTLYFGSGRKGGKGGVDLYRSRFSNGKYQEPENLGDAINTTFDEYEPYIAPDESFLIFMAGNRPDGLGGYDLYISYNRNGQWTKAQNLGAPINSAVDDLSPRISPDGKYFFWASARSAIDKPKTKVWSLQEFSSAYQRPQNGLGDIYYMDFSALKIER